MAKRPSVKGKGLDAFFEETTPESSGSAERPKQETTETTKARGIKATFYLPEGLLDQLEDAWVLLRRDLGTRSIRKSHLVQAALEQALEEFTSEQENSPLFRQISDTLS